jgi:hypothetical protein
MGFNQEDRDDDLSGDVVEGGDLVEDLGVLAEIGSAREMIPIWR